MISTKPVWGVGKNLRTRSQDPPPEHVLYRPQYPGGSSSRPGGSSPRGRECIIGHTQRLYINHGSIYSWNRYWLWSGTAQRSRAFLRKICLTAYWTIPEVERTLNRGSCFREWSAMQSRL